MPLEDFLPEFEGKAKTDRHGDTVFPSLRNSLQAYINAKEAEKKQGPEKVYSDGQKGPSIYSALKALQLACAAQNAQDVPGTFKQELTSELIKYDSNKFKYNPADVRFEKELSGGQASVTYKVKATGVGSKGEKNFDAVFKSEPPGYKRGTVPGNMQIDAVGSRLSARAVASYKVDKALGFGVLARTRFAATTIKGGADGQEEAVFGSLQDWVDGESLNDKLGNDVKKSALLEAYKRPEVVRQLLQLQVLDYLTGQTDRHQDNIYITQDNKIVAIDHDFAFGSGKPLGEKPHAGGKMFSTHNKGLPKYIDRDTATKIKELKADDLVAKIAPYLSTAEIEATKIRIAAVKKGVEDGTIKDLSDCKEELKEADSYLYTTHIPRK